MRVRRDDDHASLVPLDVLENLRHFEKEGALGRYGFMESIDYTPERHPGAGPRGVVLRTYKLGEADRIITFGEDRRITLFNTAAVRSFGVGAADAIGRSVDDFIESAEGVADGPERGRTLDLDASAPATVGRSRGCSLALTEPNASKEHLRIAWEDGSWVLTDLESSFGTRVNGRPATRAGLSPFDRISIGDTVMIFESDP